MGLFLKLSFLILISGIVFVNSQDDSFYNREPTTEELTKGNELKQRVKNMKLTQFRHGKTLSEYIEKFMENHTFSYYTNWIRWARGDVTKATNDFIRSMEWRHKIDAGNINTNWNPGADFERNYPYKVSGYTHDGTSILYLPYGRYDIRALVRSGRIGDSIRIVIKSIEHALSVRNPVTKRKQSRYVFIADMGSFSLAQMANPRVLQSMTLATGLWGSNYPLHQAVIYIVNTPVYFLPFRNVLRFVLSPGQAYKYVHIHRSGDNSWRDQALKYMDLDQLPVELGGTSRRDIPWGDGWEDNNFITSSIKNKSSASPFSRNKVSGGVSGGYGK